MMGLVTTIAGSRSVFGPPADAYRTTAPRGGQGGPEGRVATVRPDEMVEMRGLEPLTPSLQRRCSPS